MEQNLTIFNFENKEVRTVKIDENIYFVASDVCKVLEHSNPSMALSRLDEDEKGISNVYTPGGNQEVLLVNESGLYSLVLTSRKPEAKRFKKWITSEVIPSIRKTGGYSVSGRLLTDRQIVEMFMDLKSMMSNMVALTNNWALQQTPPQPPADDPSNYFRVVEYGELFYSHVPKSTHMDNAKAMGGMVASISKKLGYKVVQVQNGKYPANTYHKNALKEAYAKFYN